MPTPTSKPCLFLVVLAIAVAAIGCGGGDEQSTTSGSPATTTEVAPTETKPSPAKQTEERAEKPAQSKGNEKNRRSQQSKRNELTRKMAKSGQPIPADSPVAKEVLESLQENEGGKGKKGKDPVVAAIEEILTEPKTGGDDAPKGSPDSSVDEILEQIE